MASRAQALRNGSRPTGTAPVHTASFSVRRLSLHDDMAKPHSVAKKSTGKPKGTRMPQAHGGCLVSGAGGGPQPGSGRPKGTFKDFLKELRSSETFQSAVKRAAEDPDSRNFGNALKLLADYDDEKPAEKKQIVGPIEVRVRIAREGRRITAS